MAIIKDALLARLSPIEVHKTGKKISASLSRLGDRIRYWNCVSVLCMYACIGSNVAVDRT